MFLEFHWQIIESNHWLKKNNSDPYSHQMRPYTKHQWEGESDRITWPRCIPEYMLRTAEQEGLGSLGDWTRFFGQSSVLEGCSLQSALRNLVRSSEPRVQGLVLVALVRLASPVTGASIAGFYLANGLLPPEICCWSFSCREKKFREF
ncbi:glutamate tRNA synthetase [Striga asiatica]|uniref:Glutamate tRNA synthetase n=1 Tax=Striga asiatica TaxID=4170 RepID=A0A5A7PFP5_STRAF|nr:glutamate tRNA synthetase [Striga asiatica]